MRHTYQVVGLLYTGLGKNIGWEITVYNLEQQRSKTFRVPIEVPITRDSLTLWLLDQLRIVAGALDWPSYIVVE